MLTAYDQFSAQIFDEAGIPVLLVGDSAANNVLGYATTLPVTIDEMLPLVRAVARAARRALVVADLPFGSYQASPEQALATSVRMMKEGLAHAVKLEGGRRLAPAIDAVTGAGIPVMAHIGFTPQSEHALGGYRVQGRGDDAERLVDDALALQAAGAFAVVLEMVPAPVAAAGDQGAGRSRRSGSAPGRTRDAQVLVWTDMAGLQRRQAAAVRQAVRGPARHAARTPPRRTRTTSAAARSRRRSTRSRSSRPALGWPGQPRSSDETGSVQSRPTTSAACGVRPVARAVSAAAASRLAASA